MTSPAITAETVELLQTMIRNGCVNDGTPELGLRESQRRHAARVPRRRRLDVARFEPTAGRVSLVARMEGSEPGAPSLCLMGHTDVVPVNPEGWTRDPFGGELVDGRGCRGVGPRGHRHAEPDRVDGRGVPSAARDGVPTPRRPHLLRGRRRGVGERARRQMDGRSRSRRDPCRLRAHRERRPALADPTEAALRRRQRGREGSRVAPAPRARHARPWLGAVRRRQRAGEGGRASCSDCRVPARAEVPRAVASARRDAGVDDELAADAPRSGADRRRARGAARAGDGGASPRVHAHDVLPERDARGGGKTNVIPDCVEIEVDIRTLPARAPTEVQAHLARRSAISRSRSRSSI